MRVAILLCVAVLAAGAGCAESGARVRMHAQTLVREDRTDQAATLLRERVAKHPDDVASRELLVRVLGAAGDILGARAQVAELARVLPQNDPAPYLELGHALELTHAYDEALEAYDCAAAVAPDSPDGPREGGMRCARWGELEDARARLEEAVRRGARDAETWHTLGLVLLHLGDYDGAERAYRAGAAAGDAAGTTDRGAAAECWLGLATLGLVRGDARLALEAYDRVLAQSPRFATAQLGRAWALAQLGRHDEAERALDLAQQLGAPAAPIARQRASLSSGAGAPPPLASPASP